MTEFYNMLAAKLARSNDEQRKQWAAQFVSNDLELISFLSLLERDRTLSLRFLWLVSDIAPLDKERVFRALPALFNFSLATSHAYTKPSLAKYWALCGIPPENKAAAIDLPFEWLSHNKSNVSLKGGACLPYKASALHMLP